MQVQLYSKFELKFKQQLSMDKFVTRTPRVGADVSNKRPASSEAAGATGAPTTKKAKALAPKQQGVKWTKARLIGVEAASYQDQTLAFTTLQDGRELLLGEEVWALPRGASAGAPGALKSLEKVGAMGGDRFAALPGLDAAACAIVHEELAYSDAGLCLASPGSDRASVRRAAGSSPEAGVDAESQGCVPST